MDIKAINFIDMHCAGPLREARMQSLTDLLEEVRAEQRRGCRDEVRGVCSDRMLDYATTDELEDACLNAVGKRE